MTIEKIKSALSSRTYWLEESDLALLPESNLDRDNYLNTLDLLEESNLVTCLMGQRRCGKSVVARQFIRKLWDRGIPRRNILYVNFFLRPLNAMCQQEVFQSILDWWMDDLVDNKAKSYLILDEVNLLECWDENVASIFEDPKFPCRILITGSNGSLLSKDLSAKLGGRYTILQIYPFSFAEYCRFMQKPYTIESVEGYLHEGGLPEILKIAAVDQRNQLIADIINSIIKNDIIQRYNPSNPLLLMSLIDYCRLSYGQELSLQKIQNEVSVRISSMLPQKRQQRTTSLIETYLAYMVDVYFLYCPPTYSYRNKDILSKGVDKIFLSDLSFADCEKHAGKGRLLENMIYLEMLRRGFVIKRFLGYRNRNLEIDFWIKKGEYEALIQVCWHLGLAEENGEMWRREFGNLEAINLNVPKIVVSLDKKITAPSKETQHMNVVAFLQWLDTMTE